MLRWRRAQGRLAELEVGEAAVEAVARDELGCGLNLIHVPSYFSSPLFLLLYTSGLMPATITKGQILKAVADLPEEATVDDAIERLLLLSKIEQGLEQSARGEMIPHAEVKRRIEEKIASWRR